MRHLTTLILLILLITQKNNAQNTDFDNYKNLLKEEMQKWFTKGEFEKQSEYLQRMKQADSILVKIKRKCILDILGFHYDLLRDLIENDRLCEYEGYDAENEAIVLKLLNNLNIKIKCKASFASEIKKKSIGMLYVPIEFHFINNNIFISKIGIYNTYYYYYFKNIIRTDYYYNYNDFAFHNKDTRFPDKINIVYNFNDLINRSEKIFECSFNNDHPPDPELTLADLDLNLPDEVKAIVFNQPKTIIPAIVNSSNINFKAANNTKAIVANEKSTINFTLINSGKGSANNLKIKISDQNNISGLSFTKEILLSNLEPNSSKDYSINIAANLQVPTNTAKFHLEFEEQNGFYPAPIDISIPTLAFAAPKLQIVDYSFVSNTGKLEKSQPIILKALLQNLGQGEANNIAVEFKYPTTNVFNTSVTKVNFNSLKPNETKELLFEFVTNKNYTEKTIPITIKISEQHQQFAENKNIVANLSEVVNTSVALAAPTVNKTTTTITTASLSSDVDKNIPINVTKNPNKYALIIGNEDYSSRQTNLQKESNVPFAINDAKTFKDYCLQTLGIEEENIFFLFNATAGEMAAKIELVTEIIKRLGNKSELIVYYAGHGFPDDKSKAAYLIPVDVNVNNLASAIKLSDFYQKLSKTNAKKITVFLDACFTGGAREEGLIAGARGIKIVPNEDALSGNLVVFSATTNDQSALPYRAKQHGIFTYFLLKALQNSQGKINFANLEEYLKEQVTIQSLKVNAKAQDPSIRCSNTIKNIYLNWTL